MALDFRGPSVLGLNRHGVPLQKGTSRIKMQRGAYTIQGDDVDYKLTLVSTDGDLYRAVHAANMMAEAGKLTRVVFMPCMRRFEQQEQVYQREVFPWEGRPVVS